MLESDSPKRICLHEVSPVSENHENKTRAGHIPTPPQGQPRAGGEEGRAEGGGKEGRTQ